MKNEKIYKTKKTSFSIALLLAFLLALFFCVGVSSSNVPVSEPFSFDLARFLLFHVSYPDGTSNYFDFLTLQNISFSEGNLPTHFTMQTYRNGQSEVFLNFSDVVLLESFSVSFEFRDVADPSQLLSFGGDVRVDGTSFPCTAELISDSSDVYTVRYEVGKYGKSFLPFLYVFFDTTYEGFTFRGISCNVVGSGNESVTLTLGASGEVITSSPESTWGPFSPPLVTVPDFSSVTEEKSPVDAWLEPAHQGVGGAIDSASAQLSSEGFIQGSQWLDNVVTFLATQPLISVFFAFGCAFLITRVAFGGK